MCRQYHIFVISPTTGLACMIHHSWIRVNGDCFNNVVICTQTFLVFSTLLSCKHIVWDKQYSKLSILLKPFYCHMADTNHFCSWTFLKDISVIILQLYGKKNNNAKAFSHDYMIKHRTSIRKVNDSCMLSGASPLNYGLFWNCNLILSSETS